MHLIQRKKEPERKIKSGRGKTAFTLIELLVVLGIIVVLTGILLPVFVRAKTQAGYTTCLSNMRQIGVGLLLYEQDNNGYEPPWAFSYHEKWPNEPTWFKQSLHNYLADGVWWCPEESWNHLQSLPHELGNDEFVPMLSSYWMFPPVFAHDLAKADEFYRTGIVNFSTDQMQKQSTDVWFVQIIHDDPAGGYYDAPFSSIERYTVHGDHTPLLFLDGHSQSLPIPCYYTDGGYMYQ